jgi:hypothetical protein|tara:strand:+ start:225 stop:545 length:321 start_codon:yes stop_codon:yes gene_type:complete
MVFEEITGMVAKAIPLNSSFYTEIPPEIVSRLGGLITILKAAGIIFIAYIAFLVIRWIFSIKGYKRTKKIEKRVNEIDRKLDLLLKGKTLVRERVEKKLKKIKKKK